MEGLPQMLRTLILAQHADDEVYGCGGTIAKLKAQGAEVYVVVVSVGEVVHYGRGELMRVRIAVQDWRCPTYDQQHPEAGFVSDLSIVDVLFNHGPESLGILLQRPQSV